VIIFFIYLFDGNVIGEIRFHAQDWFNARFFAFFKKFNGAKNITMIGNGQSFTALILAPLNEAV